jgi:uncharacterized protein (TIGR01777 family)
MKVAITGSSGFIGSALTRHLRDEGHEVIEMKRGSRDNPSAVWNPDEGWVREDVLDGIDAVMNLGGANIGASRWSASRKAVLRSSRIDSTRVLMEALKAQGIRPAVWVQASGVDIYGDRGQERLDESASLGDHFLARLCREGEAEAARAETELGARVVMIRTSFVMHRDAPAFKRLTKPIKFGVGGKLGSGRQWFPWIHLEDEVRAIAFLLTSDVSGPVNLAAPETITSGGMTKVLGSVMRRPTLFPVPGFVLKVVLGEMAQPLLLDSKRVVPAKLAEAGFRWRYATAVEAVREATGRPSTAH